MQLDARSWKRRNFNKIIPNAYKGHAVRGVKSREDLLRRLVAAYILLVSRNNTSAGGHNHLWFPLVRCNMQLGHCPLFVYDSKGMVSAHLFFVFIIQTFQGLCFATLSLLSVQVGVLHAKVLQKQIFYCPWQKDFAFLNRLRNVWNDLNLVMNIITS